MPRRRYNPVGGLDPILVSIQASRTRALRPVRWIHRPGVIPVGRYTVQQQTAIQNGTATSYIGAGGKATVQVGPAGLGGSWEPTMAVVATASGAEDTSTCQLYIGPAGIPLQSLTAGLTYAGGGSTIGLAAPVITVGLCIIAVWSGGNPGDLVSLTVYGTQTSLTTPGTAEPA